MTVTLEAPVCRCGGETKTSGTKRAYWMCTVCERQFRRCTCAGVKETTA